MEATKTAHTEPTKKAEEEAMKADEAEPKKMLTLRTADDEEFVVEEEVATMSQTIRHMVEDDCAANTIPVPNVCAATLAKVLEYCRKHVVPHSSDHASGSTSSADGVKNDLKAWDAEFVKVDQQPGALFDLILAADYLDIKGLLDLTSQTVADMIKSKTPEEIRKIFNIENDFTPEEEEEIRNENAWAFE